MKPKKIVWVLLFLSIATIAAICVYLLKDFSISNKNDDSEGTMADDTLNNSSEDITATYPFDEESNTSIASDSHHYIFVGDSRYVAMESMKGPNDTFICDNGVGRYFLKEKMSDIISAADSFPNSRIVIGLGVNDLPEYEEYIQLVKELKSKTDAEIFYMLVNPVNDSVCAANGYNASNAQIDKFNEKIIDGLVDEEIIFIDSNSHLKEIGYECPDGLHYNTDTYINIFQYLKVSLSLYP